MTKMPPSGDNRIFWLVAAGLVVFVYFFGLAVPLLGPDEPRYAQVAREMFERGDWVTPTLGGFKWFEKPALLYWLQIVSYHIFGVSEFAARFGSALFGLGTIGSLWLLGKKCPPTLDGAPDGGDFGKWLALTAATSLGLIAFARGASFDIVLTFPVTASLVCFFLFDRRVMFTHAVAASGRGYLPLFGFYFFIGVALLAKGLVGAIFPFAIVAFYHLLSRRTPGKVFLISLIWGTIVALAVAAIWYVPVYLRNGWPFVDEFFIQHHFQRYTSNKYLHPQPFHFFFWVLPLMTLPWLPFFLAAIWSLVERTFFSKPADQAVPDGLDQQTEWKRLPVSPLETFAVAWMLVPLVFFSFSGSKLPGYIMPALPPAMVLTTCRLVRFMRLRQVRVRWMKGLAVATLAGVVAVLAIALPHFADMDSVKGLLAAADARGYGDEEILGFITVSHNAEFYAPGRLVRDESGKQKRLVNTGEIAAEVEKTADKSALVLVPLEHLRHIAESPALVSELIRDNGELAIVRVRPR